MKTINNSEGQGSLPFQNAYPILDYFTNTFGLGKELEMEPKDGTIYIATNLLNGKQYVGQTIKPLKTRISSHTHADRCKLIYRAIKKYGIENFKWISFSCPIQEMDWQEVFLIKEMNTMEPNGYNLDSGGNKQKQRSGSTKQLIAEKAKERYKNKENHPNFGKLDPQLSERNKKRWENIENRKKQAEIRKVYVETHPKEMKEAQEKRKQYWENHPKEYKIVKEKISRTLCGKTKGILKTEEHKRKISDALRGKPKTKEHKKNLSKARPEKKENATD